VTDDPKCYIILWKSKLDPKKRGRAQRRLTHAEAVLAVKDLNKQYEGIAYHWFEKVKDDRND